MSKSAENKSGSKGASAAQLWLRLPGLVREALYALRSAQVWRAWMKRWPSMASVGDCFDNAMCESFFAALECELLDRRHFKTQLGDADGGLQIYRRVV